MSKHIIILGTNHEIQGMERYQWRIEDPDYIKVLTQLIARVDFIFEEASNLGPTIALKMASEKKHVGYLDVDPSRSTRQNLEIPETSDQLPVDLHESKESLCWHSLKAQDMRERLWVDALKITEFQNALLICGGNHLLSMAFRLEGSGFEVEAVAYEPRRVLCDGWSRLGLLS